MLNDSSCLKIYKSKGLNGFMQDLQEMQDDDVRVSYKQVCAELKHLSKIHNFLLDSTINFVELFQEWCATIIKFLEYRLKQHSIERFPLFGFVVKKYKAIIALSIKQKLIQKKNHSKHHQKVQKKHSQSIYPAIFYKKLSPVNPQRLNKYLKCLLNNKIIPQNSECVCCSRILIKNFYIQNLNPYFSTFCVVSKFEVSKQFDSAAMQNIFNAVSNNGGGVVIIGAEKKDSMIKVNGVVFQNRNQHFEKLQQLKKCLESIKPNCGYRIDSVLVISEDETQISFQNCEQKYCIRILIKPFNNNRLSYLQRKKKQSQNPRQFFKFSRTQQAQKLNNHSFYKKIHIFYNQRKQYNSHRNILCYKPLSSSHKQNQFEFQQLSSGIFSIKKTKEFQEQKDQKAQQTCQQNQQAKNSNDLLCFKFSKQSLLIVGSTNQDKYVNSFMGFIKSRNIFFQVNHLFPESFKGCSRSVWLISHDISHNQLKDCLKQYSQKQLSKKQPITTMPVRTILQILQNKLTPFVEQAIKIKFSQHFSQYPQLQNPECQSIQTTQYYLKCKSQYYDHKHKLNKKIYYLKFPDKVKSLFAYMCFEMQQLRPYFVSEKDCKVKF